MTIAALALALQVDEIQNAYTVQPVEVNANWIMFLQFVDKKAVGLAFWSIILVAAIIGFGVMWRSTRKNPPEVERLFTVHMQPIEDAATPLAEVRAFDVDIVVDGEVEWVNFLGPALDGGDRATVAAMSWDPRYRITSAPANELEVES